MAKKIIVGGRISSSEQGGIVTGASEIMDDVKGKKQSVINQETDSAIAGLGESKQDVLTFDNAPTENSNNPVKSGGVYAADKALSNAIEAILLLIPSAATALNQLADKAFVNSSISTATATFRGTYNLITDLELAIDATHEQIATKLGLVIATADNNDYAYVQVPVSAESTDIRRTEKYKFNGSAWSYEYDLNTSGFTAAQWAAINSGITLALVAKLSGLPTSSELMALLGQKQDTLTFDNVPTAGSNNPVKSGGVYSAINDEKAAREQLAQTVTGIDGRVGDVEEVIPAGAAANNKLVANSSMEAYVASIINAITASFTIATADGHINLSLTQTNGRVASLTLTSSDIASAQALTALTGRVTTAESNITSLGGRVSTNETDIANLQQLYNDLQQSKPVPVTTLPSTGQQQGVIYRLAGTNSYSDYMWNGSTWVLMATYNNAIDPRPKKGSGNLVTSGGVFDNMCALDISELNATENPHTLATYADLAAALAAVPSDYQKGGMSVKFIQSSDNKYVQCRLMANAWSTTVSDWQEVENIPSARSKNLVDSEGIYNLCGIVFKAGYYVEAATGNLSDFERHGYSELIPCVKGMSYKARLKAGGYACVIAFYDKDMNFVSSISGTDEFAVYEGTIPSNVGYIRFGCTDITINSGYYAFLNEDKKHNVFTVINQDSFTENGYVKRDGTFEIINPPSSWKSTDFIEIQAGQSIFVNVLTNPNSVAILYFYDTNKVPILTDLPNGSTTKMYSASFVAPANAKYFRTSCNTTISLSTKKDDSFVIVSRFKTNDEYTQITGNGSQFTENGYLDANGVLDVTDSWKTTPYITVPSGAIYDIYIYEQNGATSPIVFYDSDKRIIDKVVSTQTGMTNIKDETPAGTTYIRICTKTTDVNLSKYSIYYNAKNVLDNLLYKNVTLKYTNNFVGKPFSFSGKTAVFFGDSVTDGVASANGVVVGGITECYRKVLSDTLGFSLSLNRAVSGSYICDLENSANSILNKVIATITAQSNYDYIFIAGGVNDFWTGKPLGVITDDTYATFYGALNLMCSHLKTNAPNSNVIFFTPINCTRADLSAAVNTIDAYRNAIFEVAAMNLFNVVDTSKIGFPNDINDTVYRDDLISDGVHPTEKGHFMMGKNLAAILL